jgi:hypothetical protein
MNLLAPICLRFYIEANRPRFNIFSYHSILNQVVCSLRLITSKASIIAILYTPSELAGLLIKPFANLLREHKNLDLYLLSL